MKSSISKCLGIAAALFVTTNASALTIQSLGSANQTIGVEYQTGLNVGPAGTTSAPNSAFPHLDTIELTPPHPSWYQFPEGTSKWISFINNFTPTTGNEGLPGDIVQNDDYVWFFHEFTLGDTPLAAELKVLADDTVSVWVNGSQLKVAGDVYNPAGPSYPSCSENPVGCLIATQGIFDIGSYLLSGNNVFAFQVFQRRGTGYGLNYIANIREPLGGDVPEPASMLLLSAGLVGIGIRKRRIA